MSSLRLALVGLEDVLHQLFQPRPTSVWTLPNMRSSSIYVVTESPPSSKFPTPMSSCFRPLPELGHSSSNCLSTTFLVSDGPASVCDSSWSVAALSRDAPEIRSSLPSVLSTSLFSAPTLSGTYYPSSASATKGQILDLLHRLRLLILPFPIDSSSTVPRLSVECTRPQLVVSCGCQSRRSLFFIPQIRSLQMLYRRRRRWSCQLTHRASPRIKLTLSYSGANAHSLAHSVPTTSSTSSSYIFEW